MVGCERNISSGLNIFDTKNIVRRASQHYQSRDLLLLLIVVFFFLVTSTVWWKGSGSAGDISKEFRNCIFGAVGVGETRWAVLKMVLV